MNKSNIQRGYPVIIKMDDKIYFEGLKHKLNGASVRGGNGDKQPTIVNIDGLNMILSKDLISYLSTLQVQKDRIVFEFTGRLSSEKAQLLKDLNKLGYGTIVTESQERTGVKGVLDYIKCRFEPVLDLGGQIHMFEGLLTTGTCQNVSEVLDEHRQFGGTYKIFEQMARNAHIEIIRKGLPISINIYLSDLLNPRFIGYLCNLQRQYPIGDNSLFVIELVEGFDKEMVYFVISHLRVLKQSGYRIAISNFDVNSFVKDSRDDILHGLLSQDFIPYIVKFDQARLSELHESILKGGINAVHYSMIKSNIESLKDKGVQIVGLGGENIGDLWFLEQLGCNLIQGEKLKGVN